MSEIRTVHRTPLACLLCAAVAFTWIDTQATRGGLITFDPPSAVVDPATGITMVDFDIIVDSVSFPGGRFEFINLLVGSDTLRIVDIIDPNPCPIATCYYTEPTPIETYPSDLYVHGGFGSRARKTPFFIGILRVDAAGLDPGNYSVIVDSKRDGDTSSISYDDFVDQLFGMATVTVIPEPATGLLILLGVLAGVGRRRRKYACSS